MVYHDLYRGLVRFFVIPLVGILLAGCAGLDTRQETAATGAAGEIFIEENDAPAVGAAGESEGLSVPPGFSRQTYLLPEDLRFVPEALPSLAIPYGVGQPASPSPEGPRLTGSFRAAYVEGLLQGLPLAGVLGGDLVHRWPAGAPVSWVQNWRATDPDAKNNSWGIPSLILALSAAGGPAPEKTFIVHGSILDFYGKSRGKGGANGAAGYGAPRSDPFFRDGCAAQLFDRGLILIDGDGQGSFIPRQDTEEPPPEPAYAIPPGTAGMGEQEEAAFLAAWRGEAERRETPPAADGPPFYVRFDDPRLLAGAGEPLMAQGVYLQYFDRAQTVFAAPAIPALPFAVRVIRSPFLEALLAEAPLPGAEGLQGSAPAARDFTEALIEGFSRYGLPLSAALPRYERGAWTEAQRFSRGWMTLERRDVPAEDAAYPNSPAERISSQYSQR